MITEQDLERLAEPPAHTVVRPVGEIRRRAEGIRRGRRLARVAAAGLVAAGAAATAFTVGPFTGGSTDPRSVEAQPAAPPVAGKPSGAPNPDAGKDCSTGYGHVRAFADAPRLLFLAPESVTGPIVGDVLVRDSESTCVPAPIATIRYGMDGDTVTGRVQIEGPGAENGYAPGPGGEFGGEHTTADLHGATAQIYRADADGGAWGYAWWQDAEGRTWSADTGGLERDAMVRALQEMTTDGGAFDPAARPAGLDREVAVPRQAPDRHSWYTSVSYGDINQDAGGWSVEHHDGAPSAEARSGAERVDVGGVTGWWSDAKQGGLTWRTADGVLHQVTGRVDRDTALEVARSLVKVAPDDPRLVAHAEKPAPETD